MKTYTQKDLQEYLKNDWILAMLQKNADAQDPQIRTHQWLQEMDNKRLIYADVYGDLLRASNPSLKVLDVGGGYNSLTKVLAHNTQYTLLDFGAHGKEALKKQTEKYGIRWLDMDWYSSPPCADGVDIVIANDIFPDVDQRLELFIDRMLPYCSELRLVLTYYNTPRFYTMGRTDDTEVLTFLSWDGEITGIKMQKYQSRSNATVAELEALKDHSESIYWNGRQVSYIVIKGGLHHEK